MRNPLNAVKSQRDTEFEGYAVGGGAGKNPAALLPMSTGDSEGSDETDVGAERPTPNGTIEQRNLNPFHKKIGSTLPMVNGDSSSVFNRTMKEIDPVLEQDQLFQDEMHKLNQLYEAKLNSLQAAHKESRRKIIISAMVRNRTGVDVESLIHTAAARRDVEIKSKNVYKKTADSECFKVMLESMAPNSVGRNEFDDNVENANAGGEQNIEELREEVADSTSSLNGTERHDIYNRQSSKSSKTSKCDSEYEMMNLEVPSIGVSPTEKGGKQETIF